MSRRRIQFEVDEELYLGITKRLGHGQLRGVYEELSKDLLKLLISGGQRTVGAILARDLGIGYTKEK